MSNALVPLLIGVLIGWVTYFLLDLFFLRHSKANPRIATLEDDIQKCRDDLLAATAGRDSLRADLDAATAARASVEAELALRDQKLTEAQTKLGQLNDEVQMRAAGALNLEREIKGRDQKLADLQAQLGALQADLDATTAARADVEGNLRICGEDLSKANVRIAALQAELDALKASHDQQAASREQELVQVKTTPGSPQAKPAEQPIRAEATRSAVLPLGFSAPPGVKVYTAECPQHLSDVKGIGAVCEQKLYEAGIGTFWVLANTENEQLAKLLDIQGFQDVNLDEIRANALRLAEETNSIGRVWNQMQPDDFEPIGGIGHVYEKRLYNAGICTYRALAQATVKQLHEICKPPAFRVPDFAAWIAAAKKLQKRRKG